MDVFSREGANLLEKNTQAIPVRFTFWDRWVLAVCARAAALPTTLWLLLMAKDAPAPAGFPLFSGDRISRVSYSHSLSC